MTKFKFLVPECLTFSQFLMVLRKHLKLEPVHGLFTFIGSQKVIPRSSALISELFSDHSDADGLLYVEYTLESTFGAF